MVQRTAENYMKQEVWDMIYSNKNYCAYDHKFYYAPLSPMAFIMQNFNREF